MTKLIKILLPLLFCYTLYAKDMPSNYFIGGKTYESFEEQITYSVGSNTITDITYFNNVFISINENSQFLVNQTYADYSKPELPATLKSIKTKYTFSLMSGTVDIINGNTNNIENNLIVHTPRINIILNYGQFRVIADKGTTIIAVYKGEANVLNVLEGKRYKLSENNVGIITKHIPLSTKDANFYSVEKSTISTKPIADDDLLSLKTTFNKLSESLKDVIFVIIDGKVFGVKTN